MHIYAIACKSKGIQVVMLASFKCYNVARDKHVFNHLIPKFWKNK